MSTYTMGLFCLSSSHLLREVINLRVAMAMPMLINSGSYENPADGNNVVPPADGTRQARSSSSVVCGVYNLSFNDFCGQDLIPEHQNIAALQTIRIQRGEACGVFDDILLEFRESVKPVMCL